MGDNDLVFAKGVYFYSYMNNKFKFDETELSSTKIFTTHSMTNHFPTKISSELATFENFLAYKIYTSTMTTILCPMCCCWRTCLSTFDTTFSKNTA